MRVAMVMAAFHGTDTDILANILSRIVARMSVSWKPIVLTLYDGLAAAMR